MCLRSTRSQIIASFYQSLYLSFSLHSSFALSSVVVIVHHLTSAVQNEQTGSQWLVGGKHWKYTVIKQVWVAFCQTLVLPCETLFPNVLNCLERLKLAGICCFAACVFMCVCASVNSNSCM